MQKWVKGQSRARRCVRALVLGGTWGVALLVATAAAGRPVNVVYIVADDLGYADVGAYGGTKVPTPNIDRLAARGIRFTQHYSGSTVCAPARASLMTGLHTGHAPVRGNHRHEPEGQAPMSPDTVTIAHVLRGAGYATGGFGKWGLGYPGSVSDPLKMGFDRFYGYNCQRMAHSYYPAFLWDNEQRVMLWGNVAHRRKDYAPHLIHDAALSFIRANRDRPFFLYYALLQPHAEMDAPEAVVARFRGRYGQETPSSEGYYRRSETPKAAFAAMVSVLDQYVGEVAGELEAQGLADRTLLVFTSDNGPHAEGGHDPEYFDSTGPLRGVKRDLYEGGIRVPMIAMWPGHIAAGIVSDHISAFWDVLPTVAELAGVPAPAQLDGLSMLPTLLGQPGQVEHDYLYWEFPAAGGRVALRRGEWKAVRYGLNRDPEAPLQLYNLANDPGEVRDVAADHPALAAELGRLLASARRRPISPAFYIPALGDPVRPDRVE